MFADHLVFGRLVMAESLICDSVTSPATPKVLLQLCTRQQRSALDNQLTDVA